MRGLLTHVVRTAATAAAIAVLWSGVAHAQAVSGTLLGSIADQGGLAMPGVTVTITETSTNISLTATTNDSGFYTFPSLKDGTYKVVAELSGFKKSRSRRRHRAGQHDHPRGPQDRGRRAGGIDHRRRPEPDPADRPHRHRPHHRIEDGERHAAHLQPQLPEHPRSPCRARRGRTASTRRSSTRRTRWRSKSTASRGWRTTR